MKWKSNSRGPLFGVINFFYGYTNSRRYNEPQCRKCFGYSTFVKMHTTFYDKGKFCRALCERCWYRLGHPVMRMQYYQDWVWDTYHAEAKDYPDWPAIQAAVLLGL
jgi:hypothetical protein